MAVPCRPWSMLGDPSGVPRRRPSLASLRSPLVVVRGQGSIWQGCDGARLRTTVTGQTRPCLIPSAHRLVRTEQNRTEQNTKGNIIVSQVLVGTRADVPRRTPDCRNRKVCAAHRLTDRGCGTVLYVLYCNTDGANSFMIWATRGLVSAMATHARLTPRPASQPPPRRSNAVRKEKHNERL